MRVRRRTPSTTRHEPQNARRQWGTERTSGAAPIMHAIPSRSAMSAARFALFLTVAAWLAYFVEQVHRYFDHPYGLRGTIEAAVYLLLVSLLTLSAIAYLSRGSVISSGPARTDVCRARSSTRTSMSRTRPSR